MLHIPIDIMQIGSRWTADLDVRSLPESERAPFATSFVTQFLVASRGNTPNIDSNGDLVWASWYGPGDQTAIEELIRVLETAPCPPGIRFANITRPARGAIRFTCQVDSALVRGEPMAQA